MSLGTEVGLGPGHIVYGDPTERGTAAPKQGSQFTDQSREWVDGSWVMGQMGHENRMGHMGHGSLGIDP